MSDEQQTIQDLVTETRTQVNDFLAKVVYPRVERQIETQLASMVERILEKKIEERFAFAIELLRSMNDKAKAASGT